MYISMIIWMYMVFAHSFYRLTNHSTLATCQAFHLDGVSVIYSPGGPGDATFTCFEQRHFKSHRKVLRFVVQLKDSHL